MVASVDEIRRSLEERLSALTGIISKIEGHFRDPGSTDWEDRAIESENEEVLQRLDESERKEVEAIRTALARIAEGTYGVCSKCRGEITLERLEALPYTTLCVSCAAR